MSLNIGDVSSPFLNLPLEMQEAIMGKMHPADLASFSMVCSSAHNYFQRKIPRIALSLGWNPQRYPSPKQWMQDIVKRVKVLHKKKYIKKSKQDGPKSSFFNLAVSLAKHPEGNQLFLIDPKLQGWPTECSAAPLPGLSSNKAKQLLKKNWKSKKPNSQDFFLAAYHLSREEVTSILGKQLTKVFIHQDIDFWKRRIQRKNSAPIHHYCLHRYPGEVTNPLGRALVSVSQGGKNRLDPLLIASYLEKSKVDKFKSLLITCEFSQGKSELLSSIIDRIQSASERRRYLGYALMGAVLGKQVDTTEMILARPAPLLVMQDTLKKLPKSHPCYTLLEAAIQRCLTMENGEMARMDKVPSEGNGRQNLLE